uniref:Deacetylase sirtuin-type domain-containing protein n=1 Tax=Neobodo designis TaxID=312471 RepID=A0A7S1LJY2_NEODS|mmetsp:Transcript_2341/g.7278  ORF Transcript_2341/g.7278 Transcript_2341/m.7278 type:complete len:398 (+) Transcript_2341:46-1239(+)
MLRGTVVRRRSGTARKLGDFMRLSQRGRSLAGPPIFITGAGVSTASGIPDYRGPQGLYEKGHRPMTFQRFTSGREQQQRYWARSFLGYPTMCQRAPNGAHKACASLVRLGAVGHVVTQNVDGLHGEAFRVNEYDHDGAFRRTNGHHGAEEERVAGEAPDKLCRSIAHPDCAELHGNIHRVRCLKCGAGATRRQLQAWLAEENHQLLAEHPRLAAAASLEVSEEDGKSPDFVNDEDDKKAAEAVLELSSERPSPKDRAVPTGSSGLGQSSSSNTSSSALRPDGDFEAEQQWIDRFRIVPCASCGEYALKPDMVFFGESTDQELVKSIFAKVEDAAWIVCVGTSMQVFSAYRFVVRAKDKGVPVCVLNTGPTRADKDAALTLDGPVDEILPYLALDFMR